MKLTTEQRQQLADALSEKSGVKIIDDFCAELVLKIAPVIETWFEKYEASLAAAESFISGFEDDEMQTGIPEMLKDIRALIPAELHHPNALPEGL